MPSTLRLGSLPLCDEDVEAGLFHKPPVFKFPLSVRVCKPELIWISGRRIIL